MRVLVTRPLHQQQYFIQECKQLGLIPISLPTIDILPTDIQIDTAVIEAADLVLFTSKNAVEFAHMNSPLPWPSKHVQCIGPATANAVLKLGQHLETQPTAPYTSEAFLQNLLISNKATTKNVVIVKGEGGRKLMEKHFVDGGATLTTYSVYRRLCPTLDAEQRASVFENPIDIVSTTSDDGLKNLRMLAGADFEGSLSQSQLIVNSNRSAQLALDYGFEKPALVANPPGDKGQLEAIKQYLSI